MRTTTVGNYEVLYPDEIGFAFNPSLIKVVGNEQDVFTFGVNIPLSEVATDCQGAVRPSE